MSDTSSDYSLTLGKSKDFKSSFSLKKSLRHMQFGKSPSKHNSKFIAKSIIAQGRQNPILEEEEKHGDSDSDKSKNAQPNR